MAEPTENPRALYASPVLHWPHEISNFDQKLVAAQKVVQEIREGQVIGIGSGSSSYVALCAIGDRVREEGLTIQIVTTSYETEMAAFNFGIPRLPLGSVEPDWGVDGADEVDPDGRLIKGRGGAMFMEKILWHTARKMYLAVDASKHVTRLGQNFPVGIEVDPAAVDLLVAKLKTLPCARYELRLAAGKDGPVFTESGNLILDAWFDEIPHGTQGQLKAVPGVIESGLFEGYSYEVL